jgi:hypothetical protein
MFNKVITQTATSLVRIHREAAMKLIEAQRKGADRLLQAPIALVANVSDNIAKLIPGSQSDGRLNNCERIREKVQSQTDAVLENYARVAARTVEWFADGATESIAKVEDASLRRSIPELDRFLVPGLQLIENASTQAAKITSQVAGFISGSTGQCEPPKAESEHKASRIEKEGD